MVEISATSQADKGPSQLQSQLYLLRFMAFFFMIMWTETGVLTARMVVIALAFSLSTTAFIYWNDRYGSRHKRAILILEFVLLIFLVVIIWRHVEKKKHNVIMDSTFQVVRP